MEKFRDQLNNPLVLLVLITIGVASLTSVIQWWAKARHHNGISLLFGGRY